MEGTLEIVHALLERVRLRWSAITAAALNAPGSGFPHHSPAIALLLGINPGADELHHPALGAIVARKAQAHAVGSEGGAVDQSRSPEDSFTTTWLGMCP